MASQFESSVFFFNSGKRYYVKAAKQMLKPAFQHPNLLSFQLCCITYVAVKDPLNKARKTHQINGKYNLNGSDDGVKHSESLCLRTLSIVRNAK
jgi:hypothetical protein